MNPLLSQPFLQLSPAVETTLRTGYGLLLALQLALTATQAHRFFTTERYGGYVESSPWRDRLHAPAMVAVGMLLWCVAAIGLMLGIQILLCATANVLLARYLYIHLRWKSILRGMGAPGHMSYWLAMLIFLLAIANAFDSSGILKPMTLVAFRVDFALIIFMAGVYKLTAGYARNDGFERGLMNPWWGLFSRWLAPFSPDNPIFKVLNHLGWATEIFCSGLFLFVPTGPYAALAFAASFIAIGLAIRLTFLAEMVALCCLLYVYPGSLPNAWISRVVYGVPSAPTAGPGTFLCLTLAAVLGLYVIALPLAYAGMALNFYGRRSLPRPWQRYLDMWTAFFGLILWRVFTADVINFFARVHVRDRATGIDRLYMRLKVFDFASGLRYMHVGEFITLASIFTTLKYYPNNPALFEKRLIRYARSIAVPESCSLVFEYFEVCKQPDRFTHRRVMWFVVDPLRATVERVMEDPSFNPCAPAQHSPVHAGTTPGSYSPVR